MKRNRLIEITRDDLCLLLETGYLLGDRGETGKAETVFRGVLALVPDMEPAWIGLGNVRLVAGDTEEAERCYRKVLERNPDHPCGGAYLGEMLVVTGRIEEGRRLLQRVADLDAGGPAGTMARGVIQLIRAGVFGTGA